MEDDDTKSLAEKELLKTTDSPKPDRRRLARATSILNEVSEGAVNLVERQKASLFRKFFGRRAASQEVDNTNNSDSDSAQDFTPTLLVAILNWQLFNRSFMRITERHQSEGDLASLQDETNDLNVEGPSPQERRRLTRRSSNPLGFLESRLEPEQLDGLKYML